MEEFLENYMQNSICRYLAVYIDEVPSVEDLRRFEDAMGTDLNGVSDEDYEEWATEILSRNNYMIYRIFIEQGSLKINYSTEVEGEDMVDYMFGKDIEIFTFEELWKKYILTDDEINAELAKHVVPDEVMDVGYKFEGSKPKSNPLDFLSKEKIDTLLDIAEQITTEGKPSEQQQKNKNRILQWIEDNKMTEREKELQDDKYALQEEVELLQDTIHDMEEEIKALNIIIKYLENKAGL